MLQLGNIFDPALCPSPLLSGSTFHPLPCLNKNTYFIQGLAIKKPTQKTKMFLVLFLIFMKIIQTFLFQTDYL